MYILSNNHFDFDLILLQNFLLNQDLNSPSISNLQSNLLNNQNLFLENSKILKFVEKNNRNFYDWETSIPPCGKVKKFGEFDSLGKNCSTKIIAKDNRIDAFNLQENIVHVVEPTALELGLFQLTKSDLEKLTKNKTEKNFEFSENLILD